jgi:imidazolonepropionase-like amidohydrolase
MLHHVRRFVALASLSFATGASALTCPGPVPATPPIGVCSVTAGGIPVLLQGHVLGLGEDLENGQVLIAQSGRITCVACDCSSDPDFAIATRVTCPQGVISPGLIDASQALTFQHNPPVADSGERYEHRNDWRNGENGHTQIAAPADTALNQRRYSELRALLAGVTSLNGNSSSVTPGFSRDLDTLDADAMGELRIDNTRFPLGDSNGEQLATGCAYPSLPPAPLPVPTDIEHYTMAEGIDAFAQNEWRCLNGEQAGGVDVVADLPVSGLLSLDADDGEVLYQRGSTMVWTPRHAVRIYGNPGPVASLHRLGVPLALGSYWQVTGSTNLLRELQCASQLGQQQLGGAFAARDLWRMATFNAARALRADDTIGAIATGRIGDLVVFDARVRNGYDAVIGAQPADVVLVMRGGVALYGDMAPMTTLGRMDPDCEAFDVCGTAKRVCVQEETALTLTQLQAAVGAGAYPLFSCGTPPGEPICVPTRPASVAGGPAYTGSASPGDADGDAVLDPLDNCPAVFNPLRPIDAGLQPDVDGDGLGDECDACPIEPGNAPCLRALFDDGFEDS